MIIIIIIYMHNYRSCEKCPRNLGSKHKLKNSKETQENTNKFYPLKMLLMMMI